MRIHLKAPIGAFTGYGRDGIGICQTLIEQGHDVTVSPTSANPPIPIDVAMLLTKYPQAPFDLVIHHVSPDGLGVTTDQLERSHLTIGWSMWEFNGFGFRLPDIRNRMENYRHIFAYDHTSAEAFATARSEGVSVLQGGYTPDFWSSEATRDWYSDELRLCMAGALGPRKNPYVAAEAVQELREEGLNVHLTLKCSTPIEIHPAFDVAYKDCVTVVRVPWTDSQIKEMFESSHIYLAPSWGEGKNLPALEAGTTGCALMLSDIGGHREWASPDFAVMLPGALAEHEPGLGSLRVDKEILKAQIKALYEDRARLRQMGEQAAQQLPPSMSWEAALNRLFARLGSI